MNKNYRAPLLICILLLLFSIFSANAASVWDDLLFLDTSFLGMGEITSFDVSESGNVLICANQFCSSHRYLMLFDIQGDLLRSAQLNTTQQVYGRFSKDETIEIFLTRSEHIYLFDCEWNQLDEYKDINREIGKLHKFDAKRFGGIEFRINSKHSQIIKIENGSEQIFYQVKGGTIFFDIGFALTALVIFISFVAIMWQKQKERYEN